MTEYLSRPHDWWGIGLSGLSFLFSAAAVVSAFRTYAAIKEMRKAHGDLWRLRGRIDTMPADELIELAKSHRKERGR